MGVYVSAQISVMKVYGPTLLALQVGVRVFDLQKILHFHITEIQTEPTHVIGQGNNTTTV